MDVRTNMNNTHEYAIPTEALYKRWGFHPEVFTADEARKENRLEDDLVLPSWAH